VVSGSDTLGFAANGSGVPLSRNQCLSGSGNWLSAVPLAAEVLADPAPLSDVATRAAAVIGSFCGFDRVYLYAQQTKRELSLFAEWATPGLPRRAQISIRFGQDSPAGALLERLRRGEKHFPMRSGRSNFHDGFNTRLGTADDMVAPVFVAGRFWGLVGLNIRQDGVGDLSAAAEVLDAFASMLGARIAQEETASAPYTDVTLEVSRQFDRMRRHAALLDAVARISQTLLGSHQLLTGLQHAVDVLGPITGADRVCVARFEWAPQNSELIGWQELIAEWTKPGATRQIDSPLRRFEMPQFLRPIFDRLLAGQNVFIVDECPEPFCSEQKSLGVVWNVSVLIGGHDLPWGVIGFDHSTPISESDPADVAALRTAAAAIYGAVQRERTEVQRIAAKNQILIEREAAAREKAAELARANAVLREGLARLSGQQELGALTQRLLNAICECAGAMGAAMFRYDRAARTLALTLVSDPRLPSNPRDTAELDAFTVPTPSDVTPYWSELMKRRAPMILDGEDPADEHYFWPGTRAWHLQTGQTIAAGIPLLIGDEPLGFIGMTYPPGSTRDTPRPEQLELAQALTALVALSVHLTEHASEAQAAAVLQERQSAAEQRALTLMRANLGLRRTLAHLTNATDPRNFLMHLLEEAAAQTGAAGGHIFVFDRERDCLQLIAGTRDGYSYTGRSKDEPAYWNDPFPAGITPAFRHLCETGRILCLGDDAFGGMAWPETTDWFAQQQYREAACVALQVGNEPVGMLGLVFREAKALSAEETEIIHALGNQAALAIQLTMLAEDARRKERESAVLEERARIARDLHDTLAQGFAGVIAQLGAAEGAAEMNDAEQMRHCHERARRLAAISLAEARSSVHALREDSSGVGLAERCARMFLTMTAGTTIQALVEESGARPEHPLTPAAEWCVHKFAQEALANCLKHSQASQFSLLFEWQPGELHLLAEDNGRGFNVTETASGMGHRSMRERAAELGGRVEVTSLPGGGTRLMLILPTTLRRDDAIQSSRAARL
jgi:signal transduction histidine kinase